MNREIEKVLMVPPAKWTAGEIIAIGKHIDELERRVATLDKEKREAHELSHDGNASTFCSVLRFLTGHEVETRAIPRGAKEWRFPIKPRWTTAVQKPFDEYRSTPVAETYREFRFDGYRAWDHAPIYREVL